MAFLSGQCAIDNNAALSHERPFLRPEHAGARQTVVMSGRKLNLNPSCQRRLSCVEGELSFGQDAIGTGGEGGVIEVGQAVQWEWNF
ncbi:hypothetical protein [Herbaspirillum camelliae]|uniref:hypothetical protein n=1 Tax=Herbaspirillum camelliae TaxID=1892903 RepID=UPI000949CC4A|nr:hypothetical protein [Herbaspirillum camelliae]